MTVSVYGFIPLIFDCLRGHNLRIFDIQLSKFEYTHVYSKLPYSRPIFEFKETNIEYTIWKNSHIRYYGLRVNRIFEFRGTNIEYENSHIRYSDPCIQIYKNSKPVISNMGCENTSQNDQKTSQNDQKNS
jgi:hypothetical protein